VRKPRRGHSAVVCGPFGRRREPHEEEAASPPERAFDVLSSVGVLSPFALTLDVSKVPLSVVVSLLVVGRRPRRRSSAWVVVSDDSLELVKFINGRSSDGGGWQRVGQLIYSIHPGLA
jgi:hypothetical protein